MYPKKLNRRVICDLDNPIVATKAGKLRGLIVEDTCIFRGIRYAEAERFRMPKPVTPWEGVQNAIEFGPVCLEIRTDIAHDAYYVPHFYYPQDEDCQYLNVWTQSINSDKKRPVMVWIHGGGYSTGSSVELYAYDGENLSKYGDVVVVSLNHRLNVLGYLDLSAYGEEYKYSGNAGMADIVEALKWVKENIAQFGGDPENVTIMGQSGGGGKVATLIQTPAADGLFHKAVIQSGMTAGRDNPGQDSSRALAAKVVEGLGLNAASIKDIEKVPYYKLARAASAATAELGGAIAGWRPVFDDDYFKGNALSDVGFRKESAHIPVMIGSNSGEFSGNATVNPGEGCKNGWTPGYTDSLLSERFGDKKDAVVAAFKQAYPGKNIADALMVDIRFREGVVEYAKKRAASGCAPCYTYMFNLEMPYLGGTLAWHNAEEAYMFHNAQYLEASYIPGVSEWLQDVMTTAWVNFATYGDPNHVDMPQWHTVNDKPGGSMIFDEKNFMAYDHDKELLEVLLSMSPYMGFRLNNGRREMVCGPRQSL